MVPNHQRTVDGADQYVTLGIGPEMFAVEVRRVREILDMRPIVRIPDSPPFLVGLIDVRGESVPVIDLRIRLGLPAVPSTEQSRILVLDAAITGRPAGIGMLVDRVFEVTELDERRVEPPPDFAGGGRSPFIVGIGRRNGAFVMIFGLDAVLSGDGAVPPSEEAAE